MEAAAVVTKVSPYAVYLGLFDNTIQAKIPINKSESTELKEGDSLQVKIKHLTNTRIVVEPVKTHFLEIELTDTAIT